MGSRGVKAPVAAIVIVNDIIRYATKIDTTVDVTKSLSTLVVVALKCSTLVAFVNQELPLLNISINLMCCS